VLIALATVGAVVGVTAGRKKHRSTVCSGNLVGVACNLDATCVCTSSLTSQCNGLAQSVVNLVPIVNLLFAANFTIASAYTSIWLAQGSPTGTTCASQALLLDVAAGLDPTKSSNRTTWAQSALLWNLVQSQNLTAVAGMQTFVTEAPWSTLSQLDGPVLGNTTQFSMTASGFTFDFAAQSVTQPSISFVQAGEPTSAQVSQVANNAPLDRMYSYAVASSTQRQSALMSYWSNTLQQRAEDLATFVSIFNSSSILLPFDAATESVVELMTDSTTAPFPPPLGCYPGLTTADVQQINAVEGPVFGLPSLSVAGQFNLSCFPTRPIYGVLDVLRLRLPFVDGRTGVAKQAAVIKEEVVPRAVVYSGEILSALPGSNSTSVIQADPRQFGTTKFLNHVVLDYLSSMPNDVAIAVAQFVLSSPTVPPVNTSALYSYIPSIPAVEVAVFGSIQPSDIESTVTSFVTSSGDLLFGTEAGSTLRTWTIAAVGGSVSWTEAATSPLVVHDSSFTDSTFNQTWAAAAAAIKSDPVSVVVQDITNSFQSTKKFTP